MSQPAGEQLPALHELAQDLAIEADALHVQ